MLYLWLKVQSSVQVMGARKTDTRSSFYIPVTATARKTGDYAVLSSSDICVLALTYRLHEEERKKSSAMDTKVDVSSQAQDTNSLPGTPLHPVPTEIQASVESETSERRESRVESQAGRLDHNDAEAELRQETLKLADLHLHDRVESNVDGAAGNDLLPSTQSLQNIDVQGPDESASSTPGSDEPLYDDPSSEDDGEGEWITPTNVASHKSRVPVLLPSAKVAKARGETSRLDVACMTTDYAMQNVLLQMGLNLISVDGKRIKSVKSWVLRCHACFK
jgi:RNA-binding protein NOB1